MCCNRTWNTKSEPIRFYVSFSYAFIFDFIRMLFEKGRRRRNVCKNEGNSSFDTIFDLYGDRFSVFDHLHNFSRIIHYLYGGRFINGVYWYITSLYIALVVAVILLNKLNKKQLMVIGIVGGGQQ